MIIYTVKLLKQNLIYWHGHKQTVRANQDTVQVYFCIILLLKCFVFEKSPQTDEPSTGVCTGCPVALRADWNLCKHLCGDPF